MPHRPLFSRPLRRDPLVWIWVLALPIVFQAAYVWEERIGNGPDSGASWALQIVPLWLAVTVTIVLVARVRRSLRG